ncbi:uncharacterized protein LOC134471742 [Cavia porcellus]|uniref:uncharacterized protein LOC134471742 n=1 Tax=Cavia porcellus TaxID=10141 RepID=UPI002FDF6897
MFHTEHLVILPVCVSVISCLCWLVPFRSLSSPACVMHRPLSAYGTSAFQAIPQVSSQLGADGISWEQFRVLSFSGLTSKRLLANHFLLLENRVFCTHRQPVQSSISAVPFHLHVPLQRPPRSPPATATFTVTVYPQVPTAPLARLSHLVDFVLKTRKKTAALPRGEPPAAPEILTMLNLGCWKSSKHLPSLINDCCDLCHCGCSIVKDQ